MAEEITRCDINEIYCFEGCASTGKQCSFFDQNLQAYLMCPSLIWLQYAGKDYKPSISELPKTQPYSQQVLDLKKDNISLLNLA